MNLNTRFALVAASVLCAVAGNSQSPPRPTQGSLAPPTGAVVSIPNTPWRIPKGSNEVLVTATPKTIDTYTPVIDYPNPTRTPNEDTSIPGPKIRVSQAPLAQQVEDQAGISAEALIESWEGIGQTNLSPPDPALGVGIDHVVTAVNATWRISDKCGNTLFNADFGDWVGDPGGFYFDPKVQFDPWRQRWVIMYHLFDQSAQTSQLVLAVSQQSSPIGNYWIYRFNANTGSGGTLAWADYYDLGYSNEVVTASGNQFRYSGGFGGGYVRWWNPAEIYAGAAATMRTRSLGNNPDGSAAATPRSVRLLQDSLTAFINSRGGGGNRITLWWYIDPLGAATQNVREYTVGGYSSPPESRQPNGAFTDTIDCRLMPAYMKVINNAFYVFTGLTTNNSNQNGFATTRLLVMDVTNSTNPLDIDFFATDAHSSFPSPALNYQNTCNWVFTRTSTTLNPNIRYVNWENGAFTNASSSLRTSSSSYGSVAGTVYRWGDYFAGDLDWGDYNFQGGSGGRQKMWVYAEYAASTSNWATFVGSMGSAGTAEGAFSLTGNAYNLVGFEGGSFSPGSQAYTVTNTGQLGAIWELELPNWLSANESGGTLYAGGSTPFTVTPNAATNALTYGIYNGSVRIRNCFNDATTSRSASVTVRARISPNRVTVRLGRRDAGTLASFESRDGNVYRVCRFVVPNSTTPPINVELEGQAPGTTASAMDWNLTSRMAQSGSFQQIMEIWDWNLNNWSPIDRRTDAINQTLTARSLAATGVVNRYINASRVVRARYRIQATGPVGASVWCQESDFASWTFTP